MKKNWVRFIILLLSFGITQLLPAQDTDLENLQFSLTIKELSSMSSAEMEIMVEEGDWLLLDGSLAALTLLSGKDEEYLLDAQLIQGEWKGLDEVLKYSCHLVFQGNEWADIVPDKAPRKPVEGQILLNSRVLVLAKLLGYELEVNRPIPYLLVSKIRLLP